MSRITWLIFLSVMDDVISMRIYMNSQYCTYFMIWLIKSHHPDSKWEEKHLRILKIIKCRKLSEFSKDLLQKDLYCLSETQLSFVILKIISHSLIIWSLLNFTVVDNAIIILILQMRKWNLTGVVSFWTYGFKCSFLQQIFIEKPSYTGCALITKQTKSLSPNGVCILKGKTNRSQMRK